MSTSTSTSTSKKIRAEVIDHFISLHQGNNVYKTYLKGAIVDIEPITFRNLERKGRVKGSTRVSRVGENASPARTPGSQASGEEKIVSAGTPKPAPETGALPGTKKKKKKQNGVTTSDHAV